MEDPWPQGRGVRNTAVEEEGGPTRGLSAHLMGQGQTQKKRHQRMGAREAVSLEVASAPLLGWGEPRGTKTLTGFGGSTVVGEPQTCPGPMHIPQAQRSQVAAVGAVLLTAKRRDPRAGSQEGTLGGSYMEGLETSSQRGG